MDCNQQVSLTLRPPDWLDNVQLHHEDHGGDDDGGQRGLGDVREVRGEKVEGEYHHDSRVDSAEGGLDAAGVVDRPSGEGSRYRHRTHEGVGDVADAQRQHLLGGVNGLTFG